MIAMSDQVTPAPESAPAPREIGRMPLSVFIPENPRAYARAEARKRAEAGKRADGRKPAGKRWLRWPLMRSRHPQ